MKTIEIRGNVFDESMRLSAQVLLAKIKRRICKYGPEFYYAIWDLLMLLKSVREDSRKGSYTYMRLTVLQVTFEQCSVIGISSVVFIDYMEGIVLAFHSAKGNEPSINDEEYKNLINFVVALHLRVVSHKIVEQSS